jgi:phage gp29-like protein
MATTQQPQQDTKPKAPPMGTLADPDDPLKPFRHTAQRAAPYADLLQPGDSVLSSKGGVENLVIYRELLRDDQVQSTWQQRRLSLTSCETVVEPGAEDALSKAAAEALDLELKNLNWDDVTDKQLYSVFYGWGVAEILWKADGARVSFDKIKVRDRARFRFDREGNLYLWSMGSGWVLMPDRKFWTISTGADNHDDPYGLGLAHALYWPVFFKRNDIKFWLIFLEKFGMPTALAKVPAGQMNDPQTVRAATDVLRNIATDAGVVVPDTVVIELLEAARTGSADYGSMHSAMDAAISKIVVGQTMTTDNGSSRSQAEVHERVSQTLTEADSDLLCGTFNNGPVKWWTEWNFPGATAPKVYRRTEPEEDLGMRAERDTKIKGLGYEPTEEYILETYGEGWEKTQAPAVVPGAMPPGFGGPAGNADPTQFAEGEYAALQALRAARRGDQQALAEAAVSFAEQYETILGRQVGAILNAAEESGDPEVFRRRLNEILEQQPSAPAVAKLQRGGIFATLMGSLRAQRRA